MVNAFEKRKKRVRYDLKKKSNGRDKLVVFRSNQHIYAQIIDSSGVVKVSASTIEKGVKAPYFNVGGALEVGKKIADRALKSGVTQVVFDRGGYVYHGKVKAVAEGARQSGLIL